MIKIHGKVAPVTKLTGKIFDATKTESFKLQAKTVEPSAESQVVAPDADYAGLYKVTVEATKLQSKNVQPSSDGLIVMPDTGYAGLDKVTILAAQLQEKNVDPMTESQVVTPDSTYYGLKKVTVNAAPLQEKEVTLTEDSQEITPDSEYYGLKKVTVLAQVANRITAVNVDTDSDSYTVTFADGTTISGSAEFSEDGTPTSLSDDAGNEVVFSLGNPIGAKDAEGNIVDITVGGA